MNKLVPCWPPAAILVIAGSTHSVSTESFGAQFELSLLDGSNGFVLSGIDEFDYSGFSVSGAGDINGDGVDDLIIGARSANPNGQGYAGESYVVFGGAGVGAGGAIDLSSLNGANGFVLNGIDPSDRSGFSVSGAGDVNGDGVDDIIIGAYGADPNGTNNAGESYVVFGGAGVGAGGSIELSSLSGADGFVLNGIDPGDEIGLSVSGAGDVNGDGVDDLIIGTERGDPNGNSHSGESYVVFGGAGIGAGGVIELSSLDGSNGLVCNGINANDRSGCSVSGAGDINGDGVDDLIIGAYGADPNGNNYSGESYIVFGGAGVGAGGAIELSSLNGTNGFVLNGIDAGDMSGFSVSGAGDINGDGVDDLVIGAYNADPYGYDRAGESYVVFGGVGIGAGGAIELSSLSGANGFILNGIDPGDRSGYSVSGAGDFNGDGFDDLIIGADYAAKFGYSFVGESYVVFGGVGVGAGGTIELASLNEANGVVLSGVDEYDYSGVCVSGAGDVNGDGIDDLIIGAWRADPNGNISAGESYVVFGGPTPPILTQQPMGLLPSFGDGPQSMTVQVAPSAAPVMYQWRRDGVALSNGGFFGGVTTDTLLITPAYESVGVFDVVVTGPGGSVTSDQALFGIRIDLPADINGDGIVDTADLGILLGSFGMMSPP